MRFENKVVIITGGSRGIGYATAEKFLSEGAVVIITATSPENAQKAAQKLRAAYPGSKVEGIAPNLISLESTREAFTAVAEKFGRIDILINNAGISESTPFEQYTEELFDKVNDLNVKGVFNATKVASEYMIPQGSGVILSTSSMASSFSEMT